MRIVLLSQDYPPETGAPQNRLSSLAVRLTSMGHQVTVLTALPSYPVGCIYPGYRWRLFKKETREGVLVYRCWVFATRSRSVPLRLVNFLSFSVMSLLTGTLCLRRADILFAESPPLFTAVSGWLLARLKGARFVMNVADLWVKAAGQMGVVRNKSAIGAAAALEVALYRRAALVTVQTCGIEEEVRRTFPGARTYLLTNGVDPGRFAPEFGDPSLRARLGFGNRFIVGYAGIHGIVQRLDRVIEAGQHLKGRDDILLAFFGDGPVKSELESRAETMHLENVRFFPLQPSAAMPRLLPLWGAALVPLPNSIIGATALPSKMFEAMAAGIPLLLCAPVGEATEMLQRARAGLCVAPEDPEALAAAIERLCADPQLARRLGLNGRDYVLEHYNRDKIARAFSHELESLGRGQASRLEPSSQAVARRG